MLIPDVPRITTRSSLKNRLGPRIVGRVKYIKYPKNPNSSTEPVRTWMKKEEGRKRKKERRKILSGLSQQR
jgi:hypothetical protein